MELVNFPRGNSFVTFTTGSLYGVLDEVHDHPKIFPDESSTVILIKTWLENPVSFGFITQIGEKVKKLDYMIDKLPFIVDAVGDYYFSIDCSSWAAP